MANPLYNSNNQPPQQNPMSKIQEMMSMARGGGNPDAFIQNLLQQNPEMSQRLQQLKNSSGGKSYNEIAQQLMRQQGIDSNQISQLFGQRK